MQKIIGVIALVIGILLLVWAHDMANSIGSQVQQAFTGAPTDRVTYFRIGGIALLIYGAFQIIWPWKKK
jgi:ABC-type Mn2+/Zn2+ transport system permease subunit